MLHKLSNLFGSKCASGSSSSSSNGGGSGASSSYTSSSSTPAATVTSSRAMAATPRTPLSTADTSAESVLDADSSSTKSGRRPSVDTVSTYLSLDSGSADTGAVPRRPVADSDDDVFSPGPSVSSSRQCSRRRKRNMATILGE